MANKESALVVPNEIVMNKIYIIRNHKVMFDRDLAELYGVKSIRLREQVKRNITKFPQHFMFQLTEIEVEIMVSQNAIPSKSHLGGALPFVFTGNYMGGRHFLKSDPQSFKRFVIYLLALLSLLVLGRTVLI